MAVLLWDYKEVENNQEDKKVVDGETLLNQVPGEELQAALLGKSLWIVSGETRIEGKLPQSETIESSTEEQCQSDPEDNTMDSLAMADDMLLPLLTTQIQIETREDKKAEESVKPPDSCHREELRMKDCSDHLELPGRVGVGIGSRETRSLSIRWRSMSTISKRNPSCLNFSPSMGI